MSRERAVAFCESIRTVLNRAEFGLTPHPVFARAHVAFLETLEDAPHVGRIVEEARALPAEARRGMTDEVAARIHDLHAHHAALGYALVPHYAETLAGIVEDVRFEWGKRASNVTSEGGGHIRLWGASEPFVYGIGLAAVMKAFSELRHLGEQLRFEKLGDLSLAHLDFREPAAVLAATPEEVRFACGGCGKALARPIGRSALADRCACGFAFEVPVPSLARVLAAEREAREAAQGVTHCRICNQIVQRQKGPVERAGFCTKVCAREGERRFGEAVPDRGELQGGEIVFACRCGRELRSPAEDEGTLVPCGGCALQLWVPPGGPPLAGPRGAPVTCPSCGRKSRAGAKACQYCGTAIA